MLDEKHLISETAVMCTESSNVCICPLIFNSLITDSTGLLLLEEKLVTLPLEKGKITGWQRGFVYDTQSGRAPPALEGFNLYSNLWVFQHVSQRALFTAHFWTLALWGCKRRTNQCNDARGGSTFYNSKPFVNFSPFFSSIQHYYFTCRMVWGIMLKLAVLKILTLVRTPS